MIPDEEEGEIAWQLGYQRKRPKGQTKGFLRDEDYTSPPLFPTEYEMNTIS